MSLAGAMPTLMEVTDEEEASEPPTLAPEPVLTKKHQNLKVRKSKKKEAVPKTLAKEPRRATRRGAEKELEAELEAAKWESIAGQNLKPGRYDTPYFVAAVDSSTNLVSLHRLSDSASPGGLGPGARAKKDRRSYSNSASRAVAEANAYFNDVDDEELMFDDGSEESTRLSGSLDSFKSCATFQSDSGSQASQRRASGTSEPDSFTTARSSSRRISNSSEACLSGAKTSPMRVASPTKPSRRKRKATPKKNAGKKVTVPTKARSPSLDAEMATALRRISISPTESGEMNTMVTAFWLASSYIESKSMLTVIPMVSRSLQAMTERLSWCTALVGACADDSGGMVDMWPELCGSFPWGEHLAEGGYKAVYRVWNAESDAMEAISVMQIAEPEDREVMLKEMLGSYLLHDLLKRGVCPNFVNTKQVFRCSHPAPKALWGDSEQPQPSGTFENFDAEDLTEFKPPRKPTAKSIAGSSWIFLRMELCEAGDIEAYIKTLPDQAVREVTAAPLSSTSCALHQ